jgi:hypothetical protein
MVYNPDDSRTARWPFVSVALLFAAGALAVAGVAGALRLASPLDFELSDRINEAHTARQSSGRGLAEFTAFSWDRVCVFGAGATSEQVDATLGIEWGRAAGDAGGFQDLLVFVAGDQVVRAAHLPVGMVSRPAHGGDCRTAEEAVLRR